MYNHTLISRGECCGLHVNTVWQKYLCKHLKGKKKKKRYCRRTEQEEPVEATEEDRTGIYCDSLTGMHVSLLWRGTERLTHSFCQYSKFQGSIDPGAGAACFRGRYFRTRLVEGSNGWPFSSCGQEVLNGTWPLSQIVDPGLRPIPRTLSSEISSFLSILFYSSTHNYSICSNRLITRPIRSSGVISYSWIMSLKMSTTWYAVPSCISGPCLNVTCKREGGRRASWIWNATLLDVSRSVCHLKKKQCACHPTFRSAEHKFCPSATQPPALYWSRSAAVGGKQFMDHTLRRLWMLQE